MSNEKIFKDQAKRNKLGFDTACQIHALLDMLMNERHRHDDFQSFGDLLDAVFPRLYELNDAAMSLFDDPEALNSNALATMVRGHILEGKASCPSPVGSES